MKKIFGFAIALLGVVSAEAKMDKKVKILTSKNFDDELKSNELLLVEFYAPWCAHCKEFAPKYQSVAKKLLEANPAIPVAKVNGDKHEDLMTRYNISSYPTIVLFKGDKQFTYGGSLEKQGLIHWALKKTQPASALRKCEQLLAGRLEHELMLIFFGSKSNDMYKHVHYPTAEKQDRIYAYHTDDLECANRFGAKENQIALIRNFGPQQSDEGAALLYTGEPTKEKFSEWLEPLMLKTIVYFQADDIDQMFDHSKTSLLMFAHKNQSDLPIMQIYKEAAVKHKGKIQFGILDGDDEAVDQFATQFLKVTPEQFPTLRAILFKEPTQDPHDSEMTQEDDIVKYRFGNNENDDTAKLTDESLTQFIDDVNENNIDRFQMSQPIPEDDGSPLKVLVGKNFDDIARDTNKSAMVMFYAPWCPACKELMPEWEKLAEHFKDVKDLVVAKIDETMNEVDHIDLEGYPQIMFFPQGENKDAQLFEKQHNLRNFKKFLNSSVKSLKKIEKEKQQQAKKEKKEQKDKSAKKEDL